jgi:protein-tyrosine phosphatase
MAQALLARRLAAPGPTPVIGSRGMLRGGMPADPAAAVVMTGYGLDIAAHRSQQVTAEDIGQASLILAMAREHLRHAVVTVPAAWPRAFTLAELVRRGHAAGRRPAGESLDGWLARVHAGRQRSALLGASAADDVADPAGGPREAYEQTAATLSLLVDRLAALCWAAPAQ